MTFLSNSTFYKIVRYGFPLKKISTKLVPRNVTKIDKAAETNSLFNIITRKRPNDSNIPQFSLFEMEAD